MRKTLYLSVLLLILSVLSITIAHVEVNSNKDAVTLHETVLFGDNLEAKGLVVNTNIHTDNHLFWNTEHNVGEPFLTHTDFRFHQAKKYQDGKRTYSGLQFDVHYNFAMTSSGGIDLEDSIDWHDLGGIKDLLIDVSSRTEIDSTHTEDILLSDYYDFYPIVISMDLPSYRYDRFDSNSLTNAKIAEYLRIPVISDQRLEVSITKNEAAQITHIAVSNLDEKGPSIWTDSVITNDACYFIFNNRTWTDGILDTSHIPGGYGIYCLPLAMDQETGQNMVLADDLTTVYPIDTETKIINLAKNHDGTQLLLITQENGAYWLTSLGAVTSKELQKIRIVDCLKEDYVYNTFYYEDFLVLFSSDNRFTVVHLSDTGNNESVFTSSEYKAIKLGVPTSHKSEFCWDGQKLAIVSFQQKLNYSDACGYYISVYDQTGLLYIGKYDSSLDINSNLDYHYTCRPVDINPLSVRWSKTVDS